MDGHFRGGSFECDSCTGKDIRVVVFKVSQMHCENCEKKVKNNMRFEKGVKELSTELKDKTVSITYDAEKTDVKKLQAGFKKFNYEAEFVKETKQEGKKDGKQESQKKKRKPIRSNRTNTHIGLFYNY